MSLQPVKESALLRTVPEPGQLVQVRGLQWLVADVNGGSINPTDLNQHLIKLSSIGDDTLGDELEVISLCCPTSGNKARIAYCLNNDTNTQCDQYAPDGCDSTCYQNKTVPVHQGIFVYNEGRITAAAKGSTADGTDFIFWNYSGKPPNTGPDEGDTNQIRDRHQFRFRGGFPKSVKEKRNQMLTEVIYQSRKPYELFFLCPCVCAMYGFQNFAF